MSLVKEVLKTKIQMFGDQLSPIFTGFPSNIKENAEKWGDAITIYATPVSPVATPESIILARKALVDVMKQISDPEPEVSSIYPFTIYYKSPEGRLAKFNNYLTRTVGYKSNPSLDKSQIFQKLNQIRQTYNQLYPISALTEEDIKYNQRRFNQIFAKDILEKRKFKLLPDGVTVDPSGLSTEYQRIPVNPEGIIIALQEDGIIGDDTIRYLPVVRFTIYESDRTSKWNTVYARTPYITQPSVAGEVWVGVPKKNETGDYDINNQKILAGVFKRDFIDKGLAKDYTKIAIEKTQSGIDEGIYDGKITTVKSFIEIFEQNHSTCDSEWLNNKITTLDQYVTFLKSKLVTFNAKPEVQKNGIKALETGIMAFAQKLAIGMGPAYTSAPRLLPLSFNSAIQKGSAGGNNNQCISLIADAIHNYFKGGIATDNSSGSTIFWQ